MNPELRYEYGKKLPLIWKFPLPELDLNLVRSEYQKFIQHTPFTNVNQINFISTGEENQDPYTGLGSIFSKKENRSITRESEYKYFIRQFENSFFHELYREVQRLSPLPIGRVRLMKLKPKTCYSVHRDNSIRYHLALYTNPECYFAYKEHGLIHIPADGQIYATNTLLEHTALNGSEEERIHLVFSTAWTPTAESQLASFL